MPGDDYEVAKGQVKKITRLLKNFQDAETVLTEASEAARFLKNVENQIVDANARHETASGRLNQINDSIRQAKTAEEAAHESRDTAQEAAGEALKREMEKMRTEVADRRVDIDAQILVLDEEYKTARSKHDIRMGALEQDEQRIQNQIKSLSLKRDELRKMLTDAVHVTGD